MSCMNMWWTKFHYAEYNCIKYIVCLPCLYMTNTYFCFNVDYSTIIIIIIIFIIIRGEMKNFLGANEFLRGSKPPYSPTVATGRSVPWSRCGHTSISDKLVSQRWRCAWWNIGFSSVTECSEKNDCSANGTVDAFYTVGKHYVPHYCHYWQW